MNILVTGNLGYIGAILTPMLERAGHSVEGLDSGLFRECAIQPFQAPPTRILDVRDVEPIHLEGFEAIVHLAGLSNDPLGNLDPALTHRINHEASARLARMAQIAGVRRMIFASTTAVYGFEADGLVDESSPIKPLTPYSSSKAAAESELLAMSDGDFTVGALRAATVYGVSPMIRFDLVLNNLTAWAHATGKVHMKSTGEAWRPLVHVEDVARAYLAALEAPAEKVSGQAFNIGDSRENYQVREIAETVASVAPGAVVERAADAFVDETSYRASCDRIAEELDYRPKWRLIDGARELYEVLASLDLSVEQFEGERYRRSDHLRELIAAGEVDPAFRRAAPILRGVDVEPAAVLRPVA